VNELCDDSHVHEKNYVEFSQQESELLNSPVLVKQGSLTLKIEKEENDSQEIVPDEDGFL